MKRAVITGIGSRVLSGNTVAEVEASLRANGKSGIRFSESYRDAGPEKPGQWIDRPQSGRTH